MATPSAERVRSATTPSDSVLIAGGGVAALEAMLALKQYAAERIDVELISPERDFVDRPMAVAAPFGSGATRRFDLEALAEGVGATYRADAVVAVHPERRRVQTRDGEELSYRALVIAIGARPRPAVPGAITFWGSAAAASLRPVLDDLDTGAAREIVFCLPAGAGWPLPVYEIALMTAAYAAEHAAGPHAVTIATPESSPLELFGASASDAVRKLLDERGITLRCGCYPIEVDDQGLRLVPEDHLAADRVVATPRLEGPFLAGVPHDQHGFLETDPFGRVEGVEFAGIYAAGDATAFPVKQGGLAVQQADAVAGLIAAEAGETVEPKRFRPVLSGMLLTGAEPRYLQSEITGGRGETSVAAADPLWWPPGKIAGGHLGRHLRSLGWAESRSEPGERPGQVAVKVELAG